MKIIIVGAGTVGNQLAARLSEENHDIIVIDDDLNKLRTLEEYYDLQTVKGDGTSVRILRKAGVETADLVIAVTNNDSTNVVICSIAKGLDEKKQAYRVARIRKSGCFEDHSVLSPGDTGIDQVIFPEQVASDEITRLLEYPCADQTFQFLRGRVQVIGITLPKDHSLVGKTLQQLPQVEYPYRLVSVNSAGNSFIPVNRDTRLKALDRIYLAAETDKLKAIVETLEFDVRPLKKVFIYGGTNIGFNVALDLEKTDIQTRIIESTRERAKQMAYKLKKALVLHGEGTDSKLLEGEGVSDAQVFISATKDENANLLSCLLAKKMGVNKTIAVVTKPDYVPLISQLNVDSIISQRLMTINKIMAYVRRGTVMQVEEMVEGAIQALEFRVTNQTVVTGVPLASQEFHREFPKNAMIGGLIRGEEVMIARGDTTLESGDRVAVFCASEMVSELENFFALGDDSANIS